MANEEHVSLLKRSVLAEEWNDWRQKNPGTRPDLVKAQLIEEDLSFADLHGADLRGAYLKEARLSYADLRCADLGEASLSDAHLFGAMLSGANLRDADLSGANLMGVNLSGACLREASLAYANLSRADFTAADLSGADLRITNAVETNFADADLSGCRVYGISAWGLAVDGARQQNLIITNDGEPEITVDSIEIAQFIYLLLRNQRIRDAIDTITSKAVLILGRFTEQRKAVLNALRDELRNHNLLPILFDFAVPASRDVTETIRVLAGLARFVIADVTDATEVRAELHSIVPNFTSLPVQLILLRDQRAFVSLSHLARFPWVLPVFEYDDENHLLASLDERVVSPAIAGAQRLRQGP
jgi:hypothetical protein